MPVFALVLVASFLSTVGSPGDGLGLAPGPAPAPPPVPVSIPAVPLGTALGIGGVAALAAARPQPRGRNGRSTRPLYVLVPGHGGSPADFDPLLARMGVDDDQVEAFDYGWAMPGIDGTTASRRVPASDAADALDTFLRVLARDHANIYVIAHSKGGAVVTDLVSRWDAEPAQAVGAVSGAALLDPAIGDGALGDVQRIGFGADAVPDNGMFDPIRCGWLSCRDVRVDLGDRAGVEVFAVRNPDALVTNFTGSPLGLRVFDLDDGGAHPLARPWDPGAVVARIRQAHASVLDHGAVADCIAAEVAAPGSCRWPEAARPRPGAGRPPGGPLLM